MVLHYESSFIPSVDCSLPDFHRSIAKRPPSALQMLCLQMDGCCKVEYRLGGFWWEDRLPNDVRSESNFINIGRGRTDAVHQYVSGA